MEPTLDTLRELWRTLYHEEQSAACEAFLQELQQIKQTHFAAARAIDTTWYQEAVVYSAYADFFNRDLPGLRAKLGYLQELGVTCLWLLPILESPLKDAGFDISNFEAIRADLLGLPADAANADRDRVFAEFLNDLHQRGMRLIFDIAINHTSVEHAWFQAARRTKDAAQHDFYIWSATPDRFPEARLLMKGIHDSNWAYDDVAGEYFLHRFFDIQPDLNYHHPAVLVAMTRMLINWKIKGVDGIRADAVPFLWKEDGTSCESLPQTHTIVKFFRAALDFLEPGTLFLAEACQPPQDVVTYFGDGDECQAAYHFPVMPRIYRALAEEQAEAIEMALHPNFTPNIPPTCQWFLFLRCHDELSLEMVTPAERTFVFNYYAHDPRWNYRQGEGIAARLAELFARDLRRLRLAYSIMFTLPGTPIIYYGDEFAKANDENFYAEAITRTGYVDSRNFVRGPLDWTQIERALQQPDTLGAQLYRALQQMLRGRKAHPAFGRGSLEFVHFAAADQTVNPHILAYRRTYQQETCLVIQNLSAQAQRIELPQAERRARDLLDQPLLFEDDRLTLAPYAFYWL